MDTIVTFPGRFQPFGRHHSEIFKKIQDIFGEENSWIVTSDKVELPDSPFNFIEKKKIIQKLYGFNNIVKVKSPYSPVELLKDYDDKTTSVIYILGEKDQDRLLNRDYFLPYTKNKKLQSFNKHSYYWVLPEVYINLFGTEMSGTEIRNQLSDKPTKEIFTTIFGKYDKEIFDLITNKLKSKPFIKHMMHTYEDVTLTFDDTKILTEKLLSGEIKDATEKFDGINLYVTMQSDKIKAARNKSHLLNPIGIDEIKEMYDKLPNVQEAFVTAMEDLQVAFKSLPKNYFEDGKLFINLEIINPKATNVIKYNKYNIVLHNTAKIDDKGNILDKDISKVIDLFNLIKKDSKQSVYEIISPQFVVIKKDVNCDEKMKQFNSDIDKFKFDTLLDYFKSEFNKRLIDKIKNYKSKEELISDLANHNIKINTYKKDLPWISEYINSKQYEKDYKAIRWPIEKLILTIGSEILQNVVTTNPKSIVTDIKNRISETMRDVVDEKDKHKLIYELKRLKSIGNKIVPIEGIVFMYKDKQYKLTGSFACINQLLGILKFKK